ncbi:uroporphyrinogen decarboxylase family protein [Lutispora sp.]|uniref:uroporphyrinogen decarboxylase family protein n=1 Tax=Lutispora sp. TaxID=2828727 RepID=UPI002B204441|nr:uroporphyrinogen decarboxylase family protein [Lutispora sp.]MEA4963095.1 uroporphyrinogen decarboxylase family protein [Lutispora sp.]
MKKNWTKRERLEAVLKGELPDRPPISSWRHFVEKEHNARDLAQAMLDFQNKYDWDFMKINPRAVYYNEVWGNEYNYAKYENDIFPTLTKQTINSMEDLNKIIIKPGTYGPLGEQLNVIKLIRKELQEDLPIFQTVFSPFAILSSMLGVAPVRRYSENDKAKDILLDFAKKDSKTVHKALEAIALTIGDYAAKVIESGADGLFYAVIGFAREGYLTMDEWKEFVEPYDIMILKNVNGHMVLLHTCGIFSNPQRFVDYPISSIHWAPSAPGNPQIYDCKKWIKDKTPMGGLDERLFGTGATETIYKKSRETLEKNKSIPFIFTPDCSLSIRTQDEELRTFRRSVDDFSF